MSLEEVLLKFELALALAIALATLAGKSNLVSFCFYASFFFMLILVFKMINYYSPNKMLVITIVILSFIMIIINSLLNKVYFTHNNMLYFIVFSALLMYIYVLHIMDIHYSLFQWIMRWGMVFSSCFPLAYYVFNIRTSQAGYLSMNFSNSNLFGMWILQAIIFSLLNLFWQRGMVKKGVCLLLVLINSKLLILSGTRNALLALIFGAIIILTHLHKKCKYSKLLLFVIAVFPIVFFAVYLAFFPIISQNNLLLQFMSESKEIDSRYSMWISTLYNLKGHFLTGSYFSLAGNTHNSHLVILASYGIFVLILTIIFLYKIMCVANSQCKTTFQMVCLATFFITIFMGIGEGALFSGAVGLYIPACIYLLLCRYNPEYGNRE